MKIWALLDQIICLTIWTIISIIIHYRVGEYTFIKNDDRIYVWAADSDANAFNFSQASSVWTHLSAQVVDSSHAWYIMVLDPLNPVQHYNYPISYFQLFPSQQLTFSNLTHSYIPLI